MVDDVDLALDLDVPGDIVVQEDEVGVTNVLEILERRRLEVVDADDAVTLREQVVSEM